MEHKIILGIDPGYGRMGYGVIAGARAEPRLVDAGCIETNPKDAHEARLGEIYATLQNVIAREKPTMIAVEKLFFAQNTTTAIRVAETRGIVLLLAHQRGIAIREYTPLEVKMAVCGYGRADKRQVQEMVMRMLKLAAPPRPDDAADAVAVALTASAHAHTHTHVR